MARNAHQSTPEGTPAPPMRRKSEDEDSSRLSKKPRTRVSYSCGECHRRKQKCDRQVPCSHCVARKVPELCKAYTPGKTDQDIHVRLARLEHIVEVALPQYWSRSQHTPISEIASGSERRRSVSPGFDDGNRSQGEEEDPSGGMLENGRWYGKSASGSVAAPVVLEQLQHMVVPGSATVHASSSGSLPQNRLHSDLLAEPRLLTSTPEPTAADKLKALIRDYGFAPHKVTELISELPPSDFSHRLVDHYFSAINWTRYPISERDFRAYYTCIYADGPTINPNNIRFLPLLFVVLAISVRLAPAEIGGDERTRKSTSSRFYWSSRRALLIVAAIQPDCFEMILTRMLSARFLTLDRRMTESWNQLGAAVRTAQAVGLHRDGAAMGMDLVQVEKRRRIWSHLYHADRSIALVLGRPIAIQDEYTSTLPPTNVDDISSELRNPLPLTTPTRATFMILRHSLAGIMGRMSHHFQKVRSASHYSDVLALDDELVKFMETLPPHYAVDPDISLDQSHPYIPVHRFLLVTEILFVRITLNRPYLLRRLDSDRYSRSRKACFESALKDHHIRRAFLESTTKQARDPLASAYREFQAAMIAGIYLVLYPTGNEAAAMHGLLECFIRDHEQVPEQDIITQREVKIIRFLKNRSSQMAGSVDDDRQQISPNIRLVSMKSSLEGRQVRPAVRALGASAGVMTAAFGETSLAAVRSPTASHITSQPYPHVSSVPQFHQEENNPSSTGSPSGDDDSAAQSLLDQWCNVFSGGPVADESIGAANLPWGTPGLGDVSGWIGSNPSPLMTTEPLPGVDGSDWSYWETLVNQIRNSPVI